MPYQNEMKGIKLLQERAKNIEKTHNYIDSEIEELKRRIASIENSHEIKQTEEYTAIKNQHIEKMSRCNELFEIPLKDIYAEAESSFQGDIGLADILTIDDFKIAEQRIGKHILDFNSRYQLDGWDYAIACSCGLFAAMLDLLCIKAPIKPTKAWEEDVNGIFNKWVQKAFNKLLPPDFSKTLSEKFPIGAPDSSIPVDLINAPNKVLSPYNHRLRALSHDPILGIIFGVKDMINGTCTTVVNGQIQTIPSVKGITDGNLFQLIGRMFGHLLSDVNAPSIKGNRGMGLPAPFMGLLRMIEGIPFGESNFGRQIEWMYLKGYDFRQFMTTSIPMSIMEILLRVFYVAKQIKLYEVSFGETVLETMPINLSPRFRIILALAYGTSSAVNGGKIYITGDILNANYASWMGLAWNGFHALKWACYDKHLARWGYVEEKELEELNQIIQKIDSISKRASILPI